MLRALCYRPSVRQAVCLSVSHTGASVKNGCRIMQFSPYGSPISIFVGGLCFIQKFWRAPESVGIKQERSGVNKPFYSFKCQYLYLANGRRYVQTAKLLLMNMYALLIDTMTDDLDLELHKFEFLANFTRFRRFWMQKWLYEWSKIGPCQRHPTDNTVYLHSFSSCCFPNLWNSPKIRTYRSSGSSKVINLGDNRKRRRTDRRKSDSMWRAKHYAVMLRGENWH